ncbi:MAG: DASS family sodium-coupled anion symporter [Verrucomicrobiota bacterium]
MPPRLSWTLIIGLALFICWWQPGRDVEGVNPQGWRLLAVFLPCILALMLQPLPGGAAVLLAVIASVLTGALPLEKALGGYVNSSVWMVLAAFFLARALINTGLARRIALGFVKLLGHTSLGLAYAVVASEVVMAAMIPTIAARLGGVLLPIIRSLAELYNSRPGETAGLLGRYLTLALYQGSVVACALFLTGQASNPMAAQQAAIHTDGAVILDYGRWFYYACVPALTALVIVPYIVFRLEKPGIVHTPKAAEFAREELAKMGPPQRNERLATIILAGSCLLLALGGAEQATVVLLGAVALLVLTNVLSWNDITGEHGAWDVFIWYGGLLQLGTQLKETGLIDLFAKTAAGSFHGWSWLPLFIATLLIYFYAHYAFASITAHILTLYPAFVAVLITTGAPAPLVVCVFAFFANFSAGLTHYGTTPGPILFSTGYVSLGTWWRVGFLVSLVNVAIWLTVGMAWWKLVGLW